MLVHCSRWRQLMDISITIAYMPLTAEADTAAYNHHRQHLHSRRHHHLFPSDLPSCFWFFLQHLTDPELLTDAAVRYILNDAHSAGRSACSCWRRLSSHG